MTQRLTDRIVARLPKMTQTDQNGFGRIVEVEPYVCNWQDRRPMIELFHDDILILDNPDARPGYNRLRRYRVGSVVGYALVKGEDPVAAVEHAKANRHAMKWINGLPASITNHREECPDTNIVVTYGTLVWFEGRPYTIEKAPNSNLKLVPAPAEETV